MASIYRAGERWRVQVRVRGRSTSSYFSSKTEAQRWARQQEADIDRGKIVPGGRGSTIKDVFDAYDEAFPDKVNDNRIGARRMLEPHFGQVRVDELNERVVLQFVNRRRRDGAGPSTIENNLSYLRSYLKYGTTVMGLVDAGIQAGLRLARAMSLLTHQGHIAPSRERDRRPTDAELQIMEEAFRDYGKLRRDGVPMWDIILFAIATAMRLGEICALRREDLDHDKRTITIRDRKDPRRKKGNDEIVPLLKGAFVFNGRAVDPYEILLRQPVSPEDPARFFPVQSATVSNVFIRGLAGRVADLQFRDLRHDGISRLFEYGYAIEQVAMVSGHKKWTTLKRYTNLRPESLHKFTGKPLQ
jgi:integrase